MNFDFTKLVDLGTKIGKLSLAVGSIFTVCAWFASMYFAKEIENFNDLINFKEEFKRIIIIEIDSIDRIQSKEIHALKNRIDEKEKTFSIGLRVDEHNDIFYRASDKKLYRAYSKDYDGYIYWYYTDRQGREQIAY